MIKTVFYIVFYILTFHLKAQENLVPNGSFEEYFSCPIDWTDLTVMDWYSPTFGTPNYFNSCESSNLAGVPNNVFGTQNALEGNAFCGFGASFEGINPNFREYLQIELKSKLLPEVIYHFSCNVSLAEYSEFCCNQIGIALTEGSIGGGYSTPIQPAVNSLFVFDQSICDTNNWIKLEFEMKALGDEKFLTIGFFSDDSALNEELFNNGATSDFAYYFIDDVVLTESIFNALPNIFSPNGDGINDDWKISFLTEFNIYIYNRWGQLIVSDEKVKSFTWNGIQSGIEVKNGVYFYIIKSTLFEKTGFISIVR